MSDVAPVKVGIVTVTYNSISVINDFIQSLLAQNFKNWVLYVVDNASKDETLNHIEREKYRFTLPSSLQIIANTDNRGVAGGNNQGIHEALAGGCTHVLLLNNDTVFEPQLIENLLRGLGMYQCAMIVPKMLYFDPPDKIWCAGGFFDTHAAYVGRHIGNGERDQGQYDQARAIEYAPTCCTLIEAGVFQSIGYMDEKYFVYYDDTDFCFRAFQKGIRQFYDPAIKLWHKVSSLTQGEDSPFSIKYMTRNRAYFIRKNLPWATGVFWLIACQCLYLSRWLLGKESLTLFRLRESSFIAGLQMPVLS